MRVLAETVPMFAKAATQRLCSGWFFKHRAHQNSSVRNVIADAAGFVLPPRLKASPAPAKSTL